MLEPEYQDPQTNPKLDPDTQAVLAALLDQNALSQIADVAGAEANKFLVDMIDCYLEDSDKLMADLEAAIANGDALTLRYVSHTLKSNSASLGATEFAQICLEFERMGRSAVIVVNPDQISQLQQEYERVKYALQIERQKRCL